MRLNARVMRFGALVLALGVLVAVSSVWAAAAELTKPTTRPAQRAPGTRPGVPTPGREPRAEDLVRRRLDAVLPAIDFKSTRFADVLELFRTRGQLAILVNWDALAGADVDQETRVTVQLRDAKVKTALRTVLQGLGSFDAPLGYAVVGGTVRISTQAELSKITEIGVYNCVDLIQQPLTPDQRQVMESVIRERLVGAGHLSFEHALATTMDDLRKQAAQDLLELIKTNVEPGTWQPDCAIGSASEFDGLIVIRHNAQVQEGVADLLSMLREAKAARPRPMTAPERTTTAPAR